MVNCLTTGVNRHAFFAVAFVLIVIIFRSMAVNDPVNALMQLCTPSVNVNVSNGTCMTVCNFGQCSRIGRNRVEHISHILPCDDASIRESRKVLRSGIIDLARVITESQSMVNAPRAESIGDEVISVLVTITDQCRTKHAADYIQCSILAQCVHAIADRLYSINDPNGHARCTVNHGADYVRSTHADGAIECCGHTLAGRIAGPSNIRLYQILSPIIGGKVLQCRSHPFPIIIIIRVSVNLPECLTSKGNHRSVSPAYGMAVPCVGPLESCAYMLA